MRHLFPGRASSASNRGLQETPGKQRQRSRARRAAGTPRKGHYTDTNFSFSYWLNRLHRAAYSHKGRREEVDKGLPACTSPLFCQPTRRQHAAARPAITTRATAAPVYVAMSRPKR
jgi:hypothetical protein